MARRQRQGPPDRAAEVAGFQASALKTRLRVARMALGSGRVAADLEERISDAVMSPDPRGRRDGLCGLVPAARAALPSAAADQILPAGLESARWERSR